MTIRIYTHPDVLTLGVRQGWAEPETDPARIDWPARQAAAAIPFQVTGGRPVNPCEVTGVRHGRNEMGRWGENLMADALVTVPDPRASDEAWAVTVPVSTGLGQLAGLPWVAGADDARRAEWVRAGTCEDLVATLDQVHGGGRVFAAHAGMLREFLGGGL